MGCPKHKRLLRRHRIGNINNDYSPIGFGYNLKNLPTGYTFRVITRKEDLNELIDLWNSWVQNPNADFDLYLEIIRSRNEVVSPYVVLIIKDSMPVSMLVGRLEYVPFVIKIGYKTILSPKILTLTIIQGGFLGQDTEEQNQAIFTIFNTILESGDIRLINVHGIPNRSLIHELMTKNVSWCFRDHRHTTYPHWFMTVPPNIETFFSGMNSRFRRNFKHKQNLLNEEHKGDVVSTVYTKDVDYDHLSGYIEQIAAKTYHRGLGFGWKNNDENRNRFKLVARKGWLKIYLLFLSGIPVSYYIGTRRGETLFLNFTGYDPALRKNEVGTILFVKLVEDAIESGIKVIDFGSGDAFYKQQYCNKCFDETNVYMFAPTMLNLSLNTLSGLICSLDRFARKLLNRFSMLDKIKKNWRVKYSAS
jgi:predicted GNAT family acetyltransferase